MKFLAIFLIPIFLFALKGKVIGILGLWCDEYPIKPEIWRKNKQK